MTARNSGSATSAAATARKGVQSRTRDAAPASTPRPKLAAVPPPAPATVDVDALALEFAETCSQINALEAHKDGLKERLLAAMKASDRTSIANSLGMVTRKSGSEDSEVFDKDEAIRLMTAKGIKIPTKHKKGSAETLEFRAAK
jgi:hypothetical protein